MQNQRGTFISLDKSTGSNPNAPASDWPTIRTDATTLFFHLNGQLSASIGANGTYTTISDKNRKENAEEVVYADVLEKLLNIPVYQYNFEKESPKIKRCGCYAQDFYKFFKLGGDAEDADKTIALSDQIGVLMASVQALAARIESLEKNFST